MTIIYGGSFNPPTIAHYEIMKYLIENYKDANFYFLPTNNFYHKDNLRDFHHRVEMLELLCKKLKNRVSVSDFEIKLDKYYGTYYTLKHFENPYFVMGADNLLHINKWINFPNIIKDFKFIIIPRDNIDIEKTINENTDLQEYRDNLIILKSFNNIYISSSEFRKTQDSSLLLDEVFEYIKNNNLYKE